MYNIAQYQPSAPRIMGISPTKAGMEVCMKILVVDDEDINRRVMTILLNSVGYEVSTAINGFDALLQISANKPDLLISDLNMPRMSGFELLSVVRRRFPEIPVIAISGAYETGGDVPGGVIADAFYAKGQHSPKDLLDKIGVLINNRTVERIEHTQQSAPVWIPRNGKDSKGIPYIVLTCTECLRSFPLSVHEEDKLIQEVQEAPCVFCEQPLRYIIDFSVAVHSPKTPEVRPMFDNENGSG